MLDTLKQKQEQRKLEQQKRMQEQMKRQEEEKELLADIAFAQAELNELKKEHGIEDEEKGLKKLISKLLNWRENRQKVLVSKKIYIRLCLLGIFGAHRFYAKQYFTGVLYLLLFWTGISFSMTLIDWMIVAPMQADENGNILI
ncbi:MAG: NINE protein [Agathobacter sp.]|nr:NINE protein [Agathobacter sp.]